MKKKEEKDPIWALLLGYLMMLFGLWLLAFGFDMLYTIWKALIS
jgi:hypothetical protein